MEQSWVQLGSTKCSTFQLKTEPAPVGKLDRWEKANQGWEGYDGRTCPWKKRSSELFWYEQWSAKKPPAYRSLNPKKKGAGKKKNKGHALEQAPVVSPLAALLHNSSLHTFPARSCKPRHESAFQILSLTCDFPLTGKVVSPPKSPSPQKKPFVKIFAGKLVPTGIVPCDTFSGFHLVPFCPSPQ